MKPVIRFVKIFWLALWASICTLALFIPMTLAALLSRTGNLAFSISKIWARVMLLVSFTRVGISGKENILRGQSYIIISNHQSHFDILALVTSLGVQFRWIIKKELLKAPLFGYALYAARNIFIDRRNTESARDSIRKGLERLPRGASVMFFAEGTRSADGRLGEFKKGGFAVALENGFPILPVTVNGSRKVLPKGGLEFHPGRIGVTVGDPIETAGRDHSAIPALIAETRRAIQSNLSV